MIKKVYSEKLKDPRWQKRRLEIFERDDWRCQNCGDKDNTLHVHHKVYVGSDPWDVPSEFLVTLCEICHEQETLQMPVAIDALNKEIKNKIYSSGIIEIADGFSKLQLPHIPDVFAAALTYWLRTPELAREMVDRYFNYLEQKQNNSV